MRALLLRLDAPQMSFGAPMVDSYGKIQSYPALSMLCGLLGNAMGYDRSETDKLSRLQDRIWYASRQDRRGTRIEDFQTVNLSQPHMDDSLAWTTRGELERRKGANRKGTVIRRKEYWVNASHIVALHLSPADEKPDLYDLLDAVKYPARGLFIGRKCCPIGSNFVQGITEGEDLLDIIRRAPLPDMPDSRTRLPAWWPAEKGSTRNDSSIQSVTDERDWKNYIHVGERLIHHGTIQINMEENDDT